MKKIGLLLILVTFISRMNAQELDSLQNIMNHKNGEDNIPARENQEPNQDAKEQEHEENYGPVIIDDGGDEVKVKVMDKEVVKVVESGDSTYVKVGNRGILQVIDQPDSTSIRVGDKEIRIVENNGDTDIHFGDYDWHKNDITHRKFRGHWAGFEWGINNFMDKNNTISREGEDWFMDLNTGRSWAINLNFAQYSIGFGTSQFGLLTGMGLEYNNYYFDHENSIVEADDFVVVDSLNGNVHKSKLTCTYLRVPVILEVQFPRTIRAKRIFLSAGLIAGLKLGSHTKVVYKDQNGKNKDKNKDDFNINPFRYGLTTRIGFGNISVFGDYYFTTLFVKDKGPELHPFSVGLAMNF